MRFTRTYFEILDLLDKIINSENAEEEDLQTALMLSGLIANRLISQKDAFGLKKVEDNIVIESDDKEYVLNEELLYALSAVTAFNSKEKQVSENPQTEPDKEPNEETHEETDFLERSTTFSSEEEKEEEQKIEQTVMEPKVEQTVISNTNSENQGAAKHETDPETSATEEQEQDSVPQEYEEDYNPGYGTDYSDPFTSDGGYAPLFSDELNTAGGVEEPSYEDTSNDQPTMEQNQPADTKDALNNKTFLYPEKMPDNMKKKDLMYAYITGNTTDKDGVLKKRLDIFITPIATDRTKPEFIVRYIINKNAENQLIAYATGNHPEAIVSDGDSGELKVTCTISEDKILQPKIEALGNTDFVITKLRDEGLHGKGHIEIKDDKSGVTVKMFPSGKKNEENGYAKFTYCVFNKDKIEDVGYSIGLPIEVYDSEGRKVKLCCKWEEKDDERENVAKIIGIG